MKESILRFDQRQRYVVFDFETEGLNLIKSRPWQIAWTVYEGKKKIKANNKFLAYKDLGVSKGAQKKTRFDERAYRAKAEDLESVWELFSKDFYNEDYKLVGHNVLGFDVYMVNVWRKLIGLAPDYSFMERIVDTLCLERAIQSGSPESLDIDDFIFWQYKWLSARPKGVKASMKACIEKYGLVGDSNKLHDASYDVEKNFEVFQKQLFELEI